MTKRIALVPYEPGQEPEGMVESLDPGSWFANDHGAHITGPHSSAETKALAAAVKAAKRDSWGEWRESLRLPWVVQPSSLGGTVIRDSCENIPGGTFSPDGQRALVLAAPDLAEEARAAVASLRRACLYTAADALEAALRKAGAPVDEPESAEDVPSPEERNRRQRAGLCRLCGDVRPEGLSFWCAPCGDSNAAGADADANGDEMCAVFREQAATRPLLRVDEPEPALDLDDHADEMMRRVERSKERAASALAAEDVPEIWVSRDESNGGSDYWGVEPRVSDGVWLGPVGTRPGCLPPRLADALALKPGDCRRVTRDEYERFFRPALDLPPSERYAALERMVP